MKDTIQIRMYDNCEDKMKKISIVLPVYNGAKSVKKVYKKHICPRLYKLRNYNCK